jgi:hypothetical protein
MIFGLCISLRTDLCINCQSQNFLSRLTELLYPLLEASWNQKEFVLIVITQVMSFGNRPNFSTRWLCHILLKPTLHL